MCTMVLVAATGGGITDREIGVMAGLVQTLPVFSDFSADGCGRGDRGGGGSVATRRKGSSTRPN